MKLRPFLIPALLSFTFLAACGDDDSSFAPRDTDDSSSSICGDCDDESSSSITPKSSERETSVSSSSAKSSSSNTNACTVAKLSSSSVAQAKGCNEQGQTDCSGTITDKRDNQTYKVIKIGEQWWMAENLNYKTENSFCYKDSTEYCDKYGRLYTWAAAIDSAETSCGYGSKCCIGYPARGICPEGWHIPLSDEYEILEKAVNGYSGDKLKSTSGWREETGTSGNGGDYFLFNGLPAGERDPFGNFGREHLNTHFWTASERNQDTTYCMGLGYNYAGHYMYPTSKCEKRMGSSIRCIKDDPKNISDITLSSSSSEILKSSSSSVTSVSSKDFDWSLPKETYFNPEIKYDSIIDARDGKIYKTVKIGGQTWMAENLNYADSAAMPSLKENSWCYLNDPKNCDVGGRLYRWAVAKAACPNGWHVPDSTEWTTLFDFVGGQAEAGKILKSQEGWINHGGGSNAYGFTALPIGHYITNNDFGYQGREAALWSSTEAKSGRGGMFIVYLEHNKDNAFMVGNLTVYGYSVRCIQDTVAPSLSSSSAQSSSSDTPSSSSSTPVEDLSSSSEYIPYDHQNDLFEDSLNSGAYKKFTDIRNGRSYYYLTINAKDGDEDVSVTVMAENLNIGIDVPGTEDQSDDENIERYCYNDDTTNCDKYGGLYQWAEMMQLPSRCNVDACEDLIEENHRGICPEGWHVLTYDEYVIVLTANKEEKNIRAISFGGDNLTGYSLIGAGHNRNHQFADLDYMTFWFYPENGTMSEPSAFSGYQLKSSAGMDFTSSRKSYANSVRCVKD